MSSLKATYETKEEIPSGLEQYYKEQADGSFKISLEGGVKTQADVDRVKEALKKQRDINEDLEKSMSDLPKDFDAEKWDKLKDLDPDNLPSGGKLDPDDEKEFNKRVSEAVREKERDIKEANKKVLEQQQEELRKKEEKLLDRYKKDWVKSKLAEKYGFTDPKRLRWFLLDIENDELPDMKRAMDSIDVIEEDGGLKIVGGDLKDPDGAVEVLERIASKDVVKDYKPASDNTGGSAANNGTGVGDAGVKKLKKEDGTLNITEAGRLYRENPEKAKSMIKQAGFNPDKYFK